LTTNCGPDDEIPSNRVNTTERLASLRQLMEIIPIDAYYVPLDDVGRRSWISGFSGSAGDAIITKTQVSTGHSRITEVLRHLVLLCDN
jgi:hypothetical protein